MIGKSWGRSSYGPPPRVQMEERFTVRAPSSMSGVPFHIAVVAGWSHPGGGEEAKQVFRQRMTAEIGERAAHTRVIDARLLEMELNRILSPSTLLSDDGLRIDSSTITVLVSEEALAFAAEHVRLEREAVLGRLRRQHELEHLQFLSTRVLNDAGVARMYWLHHHKSTLDHLLSDQFDRLARNLNGAEGGDTWAADTLHLFAEFLGKLDDTDRETVLLMARHLMESFGPAASGEDPPF